MLFEFDRKIFIVQLVMFVVQWSVLVYILKKTVTMPASAVYQPTTVTYEQQPTDQRWNCPISYFSRRVTSSMNRAVCIRLALCLLGSTLFIIGELLELNISIVLFYFNFFHIYSTIIIATHCFFFVQLFST